MNTTKIVITACIALILTPLVALAAIQHNHPSHNNANTAEARGAGEVHSDQPAVALDGKMMIIGNQTNKGIKGMAHLMDVADIMAATDTTATHHFMIAFVDEATGKQVFSGTVALKITNPDAKVSETIDLTGMDGHFGADVAFKMEGEYHFRLDTQLADGVKRKYHFHHVNR